MIFQDNGFNAETVWDLHISRLAWWTKAWWKECPYSVNDFLLNFEDVKLFTVKAKIRDNQWTPPPIGTLNFNVDGSFYGSPRISGIVKNASRQTIGFFSKAMGNLWAYAAEVKVILHALYFANNSS